MLCVFVSVLCVRCVLGCAVVDTRPSNNHNPATPKKGDILVFLTGQAEIDRAVRALNDAVRAATIFAPSLISVLLQTHSRRFASIRVIQC